MILSTYDFLTQDPSIDMQSLPISQRVSNGAGIFSAWQGNRFSSATFMWGRWRLIQSRFLSRWERVTKSREDHGIFITSAARTEFRHCEAIRSISSASLNVDVTTKMTLTVIFDSWTRRNSGDAARLLLISMSMMTGGFAKEEKPRRWWTEKMSQHLPIGRFVPHLRWIHRLSEMKLIAVWIHHSSVLSTFRDKKKERIKWIATSDRKISRVGCKARRRNARWSFFVEEENNRRTIRGNVMTETRCDFMTCR